MEPSYYKLKESRFFFTGYKETKFKHDACWLVSKEDLQLFRQQLLHILKIRYGRRSASARPMAKKRRGQKTSEYFSRNAAKSQDYSRVKSGKIGGSFYYQSIEIQNLLGNKNTNHHELRTDFTCPK